jgi:predicted metal-dependent hydrolase
VTAPSSGFVVETEAVAVLPGGPLPYVVRRSPRARRLRVTIDPRRGVVVSLPPGDRRGWRRPDGAIEAFLAEREAWIRRHLDRAAVARARVASADGVRDGAILRFRGEPHRLRLVNGAVGRSGVLREGADAGDELIVALAARDRRPPERVLRDWLVERARTAIDREIANHAGPLGVSPAAATLRDPRTRWGSATREGRLSFSWRLVLAPPDALETVVVHELAHLRVFGHGPKFWELVATRRPDHRVWRRWLREHSLELHAALG